MSCDVMVPSHQVTHVVMFDFPNTIADYLHRVGRTGRVGSGTKCKATAFMTHRRDIQMAWKIKVMSVAIVRTHVGKGVGTLMS